jgi:hypothetical protein
MKLQNNTDYQLFTKKVHEPDNHRQIVLAFTDIQFPAPKAGAPVSYQIRCVLREGRSCARGVKSCAESAAFQLARLTSPGSEVHHRRGIVSLKTSLA